MVETKRLITMSLTFKAAAVQFEQLYKIFTEKKKTHIDNFIEKIIVVCPEPKEKRNMSYYKYEIWIERFKQFNVSIDFIDYTGDNKHHSYDQWIQGYLYYPDSDYYIVMEDDYCIDPTNITFDIDLIQLYKKKCPDNIGYLGCSTWDVNGFPTMTISNGIISRETFKKIGTNILEKFYKINTNCPQESFSRLFFLEKIKLYDLQDEYTFPFWESWTKKMVSYPINNKPNKFIMLPVQLVE